MVEVKAEVQRYYGDRPLMQRIEGALLAAGADAKMPRHRDLWPFEHLHLGGVAATREHAALAQIRDGMYVLDLGCGIGGASRYLAAELGCRVAAIDLTPSFVEVARELTSRCGLAEKIDVQQADALALPFEDGVFDHVWSHSVTMNIADKSALAREITRVLKVGGCYSCVEMLQGSQGAPVFPLPWATDVSSSFLASPAEMRAALEAAGLRVVEQRDLVPSRLGMTEANPVIAREDFAARAANVRDGMSKGRLLEQFFLAERVA